MNTPQIYVIYVAFAIWENRVLRFLIRFNQKND